MSVEWTDHRLNIEELPYRILRAAAVSTDQHSLEEIVEDYERFGMGSVQEVLDSLEDHGVLDVEETSDGKRYQLDRKGLQDYMEDLWEEEYDGDVSVETDFFNDYVTTYLQKNMVSTLKKMLADDLHDGLKAKADFEMESTPGELLTALGEMDDARERTVAPHKSIQQVIDQSDV
ncbi:MAG: hypothetical protein ABEK01_03745 [Candidatus Nanohaloarchaea archaeon]